MSVLQVDSLAPRLGGTTFGLAGVAKAYAQWRMNGTLTVNNSDNVTSITDRGVGSSTVNLTNAMSDALMSHAGMAGQNPATAQANYIRVEDNTVTVTSSAIPLFVGPAASPDDPDIVSYHTFGDLA